MPVRIDINDADLADIRRYLAGFVPRVANKGLNKAGRSAIKAVAIPVLRRATPVSKDKWGMGSKGRKIKTHRGGNLKRSWKTRGIKRSRRAGGARAVNWGGKSGQNDGFYGKFVELGRTFNMFLDKHRWAMVPSTRKGRSGDLWRPGKHMWLHAINAYESSIIAVFRRDIWIEMRKIIADERRRGRRYRA